MKRIFATLMILAILPVFVFAQKADMQSPNKMIAPVNTIFQGLNPGFYNSITPKFPSVLPLTSGLMSGDTIEDGVRAFDGQNTRFVYEPKSNTLIFVGSKNYNRTTSSNYCRLYITYSQNNGTTWSRLPDFFDDNGMFPNLPTIAVTNPNALKDPTQFNYMIQCPYFDNTGYYKGGLFVTVDPSAGASFFSTYGPLGTPSATTQMWFSTDAVASDNGTKGQIFYNAGKVNGNPYGYYALSNYDLAKGDFVVSNCQIMPPQWGIDRFRNEAAGSYNNNLYLDVDAKGNAYAGVINFFSDDITHRIPAVSTSTDNGQTWNEFDRLPLTVFDNYITSHAGDPDPTKGGVYPYKQDGFVVTGVDQFSFFFRLGYMLADASGVSWDLVEAYKQNGTWGMKKVGTYSGENYQMDHYEFRKISGSTAFHDSLVPNETGYELQLSRTADYKYIVAKWVDYNGKSFPVTPPYITDKYVNSVNVHDTTAVVGATDIYMAYRLASGGNWSDTINVTKNDLIDRYTNIPKVIPNDLSKVPVMSATAFIYTYNTGFESRNIYGSDPNNISPITQLFSDIGQALIFTSANIGKTPVKETEPVNFKLDKIYPNPAQDVAELTFNTDVDAVVNIDLFTVLGQKVKNVYNSNLESGIHGINIPVSDLSAGSYFVKISVGSNTATTVLNVVR